MALGADRLSGISAFSPYAICCSLITFPSQSLKITVYVVSLYDASTIILSVTVLTSLFAESTHLSNFCPSLLGILSIVNLSP